MKRVKRRPSKAKKIPKSRRQKLAKRKVEFQYYAPQARSVLLAGTFNQWRPELNPLRKGRKGYWKLTLLFSSGRYEFRYLVDGNWQNAQEPIECVPNVFGTWNCVIEVQ